MHRLNEHLDHVEWGSAEEYLDGCEVTVFDWKHPLQLVAPGWHLPTMAADEIKTSLPQHEIRAVFLVPTLDLKCKAIVYHRPPGARV
jgi:hypothetical protein